VSVLIVHGLMVHSIASVPTVNLEWLFRVLCQCMQCT